MLGPLFDEQIFINGAHYMQFSGKEVRIINKSDILCRQFDDDLGEVTHPELLLPEKLVKILTQPLHGTTGKHPGTAKMTQEVQ